MGSAATAHGEDGGPVPGDPPIGPGREPAAYLAVEVPSFGGLHGDVTGEGVEQRDVLVRRIAAGPDVKPRPDGREVPGRLELGGRGVPPGLGRWRRPGSAVAFTDL